MNTNVLGIALWCDLFVRKDFAVPLSAVEVWEGGGCVVYKDWSVSPLGSLAALNSADARITLPWAPCPPPILG